MFLTRIIVRRIAVNRTNCYIGAQSYKKDAYKVLTTVNDAPKFTRERRYASVATAEKPDMFCYQCEQTKSRKGCMTIGVCGKTAGVSALQDVLVYALQGLSMYAARAIDAGVPVSEECDLFVQKALFSTLTNVNFDQDRFPGYIKEAIDHREAIKQALIEQSKLPSDSALHQSPADWFPQSYDPEYLEGEGHRFGVLENREIYGEDVNGVRYMTVYGIKGLAAYACHAHSLGQSDPEVAKYIYKAFDFLVSGNEADRHDLTTNLKLALKAGEINLRVMELLDKGHREQLGVPTPTEVKRSPVPGKCILVSGHDMSDLYTILKNTEGEGINVYTHGEMLPAHSYPKLKQFKHLVGQFGGAWQNQKIDFSLFPGPVVVTTNCVIEPLKSYKERLYTLNETGINGVKHLDVNLKEDMGKLIKHTKELNGFDEKSCQKYESSTFSVGFGREVILDNAAQVLDAVQSGVLKRIFVIGGCDGSEHKRNYFTTLAKSLPPQTLILTMGCAKYRINDHEYGTLGDTGIPRLLDLGQCNDSYGAVVVAKALASALNTDINSLPLSLSLSWFEQKAVAVLLSLLSLGVKNIRLGPVMPAFLTPTVRKALEDEYGIVSVDIRNPLEDMEGML